MTIELVIMTILLLACLLSLALWLHRLLDGRNFLLDNWERFRLHRRPLEQWDAYCQSNPNRSDIVISFTTIPERIDKVHGTVKSLLAQAMAPRAIHLYVPTVSHRSGATYKIPFALEDLKSIRIIRCADHGPATKFLDALKSSAPDQRILVVDDDKLYPRQFVAQIDRASAIYPAAALGYSGWRVPEDLTDRPTTLWSNIFKQPPAPVKATRVSSLYCVDILQGYSGYLVRPAYFDLEAITNYQQAPDAAFFVDDVWMSAHCRAPKYVFPAKRFCFENFRNRNFYKRTSLGLLNSGEGDIEKRNNTILIRFFKDRWQHADCPPVRTQ